MLKTITASVLVYESGFGDFVFQSVPVMVDASVDEKTFNPLKDDFGLRGDVIDQLERISAKKWFMAFMRFDEDGNHARRWLISKEEAYAIMILFAVNATEFGHLIGCTKGNVSKIMNGAPNHHITPTAAKLIAMIMEEELKRPGYARRVLRGKTPRFDLPEGDEPIPFPQPKRA